MNEACFCDYDSPILYVKQEVKAARVSHRCYECSKTIKPGEGYERVRAIWERGDAPQTVATCQRCLALREWVKAHVPCFCWAHGNIIDDAIETAQHYAHDAPGLLFRAYRLKLAIRRHA